MKIVRTTETRTGPHWLTPLVITSLLTLFLLGTANGCQTVSGLGRDITGAAKGVADAFSEQEKRP